MEITRCHGYKTEHNSLSWGRQAKPIAYLIVVFGANWGGLQKKFSTRHVIAQRTREDGKSSCPRCTAYVHISCSHSMDVLQAKSNFLSYSTQQYNPIDICKSKSPWWCHCLINTRLTTRYALASVPRQQVQTITIIATGLLGLFWPARTLIPHKLNHEFPL